MKKLGNYISKLSLKIKLFLAIVSCILIPIFISYSVSNYLIKNEVVVQTRNFGQQALNSSELYVENNINLMVQTANNIQFNSGTTSLLKELGQPGTEISDIIIKGKSITNMVETMVSARDKMYMTILLPNGYHFTNYQNGDFNPTLFKEETWFKQLDTLSHYDLLWFVHKSYVDRGNEETYLITMARTLKTENNKPFAYIIISLGEKLISNFFKNYSDSQEIMMIDQNGMVISHPNSELVAKMYHESNILLNNKKSKLVKINNEDYLLQTKLIKSVDWKIVSLMPYKHAINEILFFRKTDTVIQYVFLSLFVLILIYLVRQFLEPLNHLSQIAKRVEMGDLEVRSGVNGKDEVGKLGFVFDKMLDRINKMLEQIKEEQSRKRMAELKMLQAQINPHFLFNVLNSIRTRVYLKGDKESADLISSLSYLLRMTINNKEMITLQDEVETVKGFVKLMRIRQKDLIELDVQLVHDSLTTEIPRFTLQPIVENSIIHGLRKNGGMLSIHSEIDQAGFLHIYIEDSGVGMTKDQLETLHLNMKGTQLKVPTGFSGLGLRNVFERLAIIYGEMFQMEINSNPSHGTSVHLRIPITQIEGE
jgi:two-component system sensor histidine kinase YesM